MTAHGSTDDSCDIRTIRIDALENIDEVRKSWLDLQSRVKHSFFCSWGWISVWLMTLPSETTVTFVARYIGDIPSCCFLLGIQKQFSHKVFWKNRGFLNTTGVPECDDLSTEYNFPLIDTRLHRGGPIFLDPALSDIEEFVLPATPSTHSRHLFYDNSFLEDVEMSSKCSFVDLAGLRNCQTDYLSTLSKSTRHRIRRSIREYRKDGPLRIRAANSVEDALVMLDALGGLHQAEWTKRGHPGSFSTEYFWRFHRELIAQRFEFGEIQVLEIISGSDPIGYLYNFVYDGSVLFYQSGFQYRKSNHYRPGLVSHFLAIQYNLERQYEKYNFLAGQQRYKEELSNDSETLQWRIVSRKTIRARIEQLLVKAKRRLFPDTK